MKGSVLILAGRYAEAVLELAVAEERVDEVGTQLESLAAACFADKKTRAFWRSLKVPEEEKRHTLQDLLEQMDALTVTRNTANLLMDRGRFELLPNLVRSYRDQAWERSGRAEATVRTATPLSEQMEARLVDGLSRMTGKSITLKAEVDPELLGGIQVQIGNRIIDGSALGRLRAIGRRFV